MTSSHACKCEIFIVAFDKQNSMAFYLYKRKQSDILLPVIKKGSLQAWEDKSDERSFPMKYRSPPERKTIDKPEGQLE